MGKPRPILDQALDELREGDVLVVAKADRLARSLGAYVRLIERARSERWAIVAADGSIDLTTPTRRAMSAMACVFGELEAELIGERTKVPLAAAKAQGAYLGRRPLRSRRVSPPRSRSSAARGSRCVTSPMC